VTAKLHVLVPFWGLAGGVIKVLDYAEHGVHAGFDVTLWGPDTGADDPLVTSLPVMERLTAAAVTHRPLAHFAGATLTREDRVLFTEPAHGIIVDKAGVRPDQVVHLVQGTRHATPTWNNGLNYRLLHRPFVRIAVSAQVHSAVSAHVNPALPLHLVAEGHDVDYFSFVRTHGDTGRVRVLYSTWKSDLGDRVAALCQDDGIDFAAMRSPQSWPQLRAHYWEADIFLAAPGPEEGFYLPGLEAMAAQCALVMALVGGNEAYARPEHNMIECAFDDAEGHAQAIRRLATSPEQRRDLTAAGAVSATEHQLDSERETAMKILLDPTGNYDDDQPISMDSAGKESR